MKTLNGYIIIHPDPVDQDAWSSDDDFIEQTALTGDLYQDATIDGYSIKQGQKILFERMAGIKFKHRDTGEELMAVRSEGCITTL